MFYTYTIYVYLREKIWTVAANVIQIWVGLKNPVVTLFNLKLCAITLDNYYICDIEYSFVLLIVLPPKNWRT